MGKPKTTLFTVTCTTCKARIKVLDASAIGEIYACPKCESMVKLAPPPGWNASEAGPPSDQDAAASPAAALPQADTAPDGGLQTQAPTGPSAFAQFFPWLLVGVAGLLLVGLVGWLSWELLGKRETPVAAVDSDPAADNKSEPAAEESQDEPTRPKKQTPPPEAEEPAAEPEPQEVPITIRLAADENGKLKGIHFNDKPVGDFAQLRAEMENLAAEHPEANFQAKVQCDYQQHFDDARQAITAGGALAKRVQLAKPDKQLIAKVEPQDPPPVAEEKDPPAEPMPQPGPPPEPVEALPTEEVQTRLARRLVNIRFDDSPLIDVVETLAGVADLAVTFDVDALNGAGVTAEQPVSLQMEMATVGEVLDTLLAGLDLGYVIEGGQILITSRARQEGAVRTVTYPIADLKAAGMSQDELSKLVQAAVHPGSWDEPEVKLDVSGGELAVTQHYSAQRLIGELLDKLRLARRIRPAGEQTLTPRLLQAEDKLLTPLTANFREAPLERILQYLKSKTDTNILIDSLALATVGITPETKADVRTAEKRPLGELLDDLLRPLGLTWLVVDKNTIQVTTQKFAAQRMQLELYPIGDLIRPERTAEQMVALLRGQVQGDSWHDQGGPGTLYYDAPSKHVIVVHHQAAHELIQRLLVSLRTPAPDAQDAAAAKKAAQNPR